jgi:16S rRNA G1207 methylase RsmC
MKEHYFSPEPESDLKLGKIEVKYQGNDFAFYTSSGVFGKKKADAGSMLLVESAKIEDKEGFSVLDLGCGYGLIGITIKKTYPNAKVICSDVNKRAVMLTKKNAEANNVELNALQSDIFSNIKENFDAILVNLPQHAGKDICFKMIEESYKHLNSNGSLQVVSRHQKGGKSYQKKMEEVFGNCTDIGKGSGYRVYMSVKG